MKSFSLFTSLITAAVVVTSTGNVKAALAIDDASNSAYNPNWETGDNGGSGFGAWTISAGSANNGVFVGASGGNGGESSLNIDVSSKSWGLWAKNGATSEATRSLSSALAVGQTFILKMDNGYVNSGASIGFGLRNGANDRFEFYFRGGQTIYEFRDNSGADQDTSIDYTADGLTISFQLTGANSYSLDVNGGAYTHTGTLSGSGSIDALRFFNYQAGDGENFDLFFNQLQVVPEPANMALAGFGGLFAALTLARSQAIQRIVRMRRRLA